MIDTRRPSRCRGELPLLLGPPLGLASARPLQAAFKSGSQQICHPSHLLVVDFKINKLIGINESHP